VHLEGIYNGNDQRLNFNQLINSSGLQANNLSLFEYGVYGQVGYDLHPLVRVNLGHIYYPAQSLNLLLPSISYSVGSNWELYGLAQLFMGQTRNLLPEGRSQANSRMNLMSLRVQWSF
jgi:hypothetical protein